MDAAKEAVDCLEKNMLTELKSLASPPAVSKLLWLVCS